MAKTSTTIEEKIARLEGIKEILDFLDSRISDKTTWAEDYLESSKNDEGEVDTESYNYERYLNALNTKNALEALRDEIENLAD